MKRASYIYDRLCDRDLLEQAFWEASRGKRNKLYVKPYLEKQDYYIDKLLYWLKTGTLKLSNNRRRTIYEKSARKTREIIVPKFFPDQVVHWAYCLAMRNIFMKGMYKWNCGSIKGRGVHYGINKVQKILKSPKAKYILKTDIKKYFQSVSGDKLYELLARKIKDKRMLALSRQIIDNGLLDGKGIPIGYYTSQWFSNFYLESIDHFVKEQLRVPHYVRYVDDMVFFDSNKRRLHGVRKRIADKLSAEQFAIIIKGNWQVWKRDSRPLDFLGFAIVNNRKRLRKRAWFSLNRIANTARRRGYCSVLMSRSFLARLGWLEKCSNGVNYYASNIKQKLSKGEACTIVSFYDKKQNIKAVKI